MSVAQPAPVAPRQSLRSWLPTIAFNIALPTATYVALADAGVNTVLALTISGVWPLAELLFTMLRRGHADEFSIFVLVALVLGVASSLLFNSARLALVKDSAFTGLFGLVLLGSLLLSRPLMFYFGRRFATDGTPAGVAWWNGLWRYPEFRRGQRLLTLVWALAFIGEAALRIVLSFLLPVATMVVISNVLPYVVLAALIFGTTVYGRRSAARGAARRAAAD